MAAQTLDVYLPYDAGAGSAVTEDGWRSLVRNFSTNGPVRGDLSQFDASATAGRAMTIGSGRCILTGQFGELSNAATVNFATNTSGSTRIDLVVLRNRFVDNRIELDVLQGTPSGTPVEPALTQNTAIWEERLYAVTLANNYTAIISGNWVDRRTFAQGRPPGGPLVVACAARRTTSFAFSIDTWTVVPFTDVDEYDTAAIHDPGFNASRFTIPAGCSGLWVFTFQASVVDGVGALGAQIWVNGTAALTPMLPGLSGIDSTEIGRITAYCERNINAGDYVQWATWTTDGHGGGPSLTSARGTARYLGPLA